MHLTHRPYDELSRDFDRIWHFLLDDYRYRQEHFIWLFSRFGDWKYGLWGENKFFPPFFRENAHLWFNDLHELLGLVICESGDSNFTIFTRQGYDFLYADILEWVTMHWQQRGRLKTEIHEFQPEVFGYLEQCGFTNRGPVAITRQYDLAKKVAEPIVLADGFKIVDGLTDTNYASKRRLQRNAFANQDTVRDIDLWAYAYSRECPCYFPQYDFSVITAEGVHVASCVGFVDFENRVAEIERICTLADYRRRGLAEAVVRACFHRLAADGIKIAYITAYGDEAARLYGKLGATREKRWSLYETG
jgi:ribosomal protein S18 acetylase RimI-like enzyme